MKNVDTFKINPEKILKNDELSKLRGGVSCICTIGGQIVATGFAQDAGQCDAMCDAYGAEYIYMAE